MLNIPPPAPVFYLAEALCSIASLDGSHARFNFAEAQWAVTPGQLVVVYDGEVCLGGRIISSRSDAM